MAEFQKVMKDYCRMNNTYNNGHCDDCPLSKKNNEKQIGCDDFLRLYPKESEQIIEDWADKNPVITNEMMFEKVFGHKLYTLCYAKVGTYGKCDNNCEECLYFAGNEYHAPERSKKE